MSDDHALVASNNKTDAETGLINYCPAGIDGTEKNTSYAGLFQRKGNSSGSFRTSDILRWKDVIFVKCVLRLFLEPFDESINDIRNAD